MSPTVLTLTSPPIFAASGNGVGNWFTESPAGIALNIFLIVFFVLLNGFFVAAEFAIVKVRTSQLEALIEAGRRQAKISKHVVGHLDAYLSATQLGITIASLILGGLGEPFLASLIEPWLVVLTGAAVPPAVIHTIAFAISLSIITFLHVVLGELMPKSLAIRRSLGVSLSVARPLTWFYFVFRWPIFILNGCANKLLKWIFKVDPVSETEHLHSAEELKLLVEETEKSQEVTDTEREILIAALELNDLHVRDVLTPRNEVVTLDPSQTFQENLETAVDSGHTRFPLVSSHLDNTLGMIHIKDILRIVNNSNPDLPSIKRAILTVPELMALDDLLKFFLKEKVHMALVVDEFGGTLGIVMLDDVIEELVGDIQDEFDRPEDEREFFRISDDEFIVEGTMPLYELADHSDLDLESPDVSTIGGYVTHLVGRLPQKGEHLEIDGYDATVIATDGKSVGRIRFRTLPAANTATVDDADNHGTLRDKHRT